MLRDFLFAMAKWIFIAVLAQLFLAFDIWDRWIAPAVPHEWRGAVEGIGGALIPVLPAGIVLAGAFLVYMDIRHQRDAAVRQGESRPPISIAPNQITLPWDATADQIAAAGSAVRNFTAGTSTGETYLTADESASPEAPRSPEQSTHD